MNSSQTGLTLTVVLSLALILFPQLSQAGNNPDALLQFTAGGHVLGFQTTGMYVAAGDHMLKTTFVNANNIIPAADQEPSSYDKTQQLGKVTYADLWDGITLTYEQTASGIAKSTYVVQPGADAGSIRLTYNVPAVINNAGQLEYRFETGRLTESAPIAWQVIDREKVPVDVKYMRFVDMGVGFELGQYDDMYEVVIDPALTWNTFLGATGNDKCFGIALDANNKLYVIGSSEYSWGSPITDISTSGSDVFVAKLNSDGTLVWNTFLGGSAWSKGADLKLDVNGNIFITGISRSTWGAPVHPFTGGDDAFVAKYNQNGVLQWNTFVGGSGVENGAAIAIGTNGNIFIAGESDLTWGTPINAYASSSDAFVAKLNGSGYILWHTFHGSTSIDKCYGIAVDDNGNAYVVGSSSASWGSPINPAYFPGPFTPSENAFIFMLNSSGIFQWNTFWGRGSTRAHAIIVDKDGNLVITGPSFDSWGTPINPKSWAIDCFVAKLNTQGALLWNTYMGGGYDDWGNAITVDRNDNIFVAGFSRGTWGSPLDPHVNNTDAFAAKLDSSGALQWHTFVGGWIHDRGEGIAVDGNGSVYVTGWSDASWGSPVRLYTDYVDAFVANICVSPTPTISVSPSPAIDPGGAPNTIYLGYGPQSVTLTASGGESYSWSPSTYLNCTNCAVPVMTPTSAGSYTYTVTATNFCGRTGTASVTIDVIDVFGGNNQATICLNGKTKEVNYHALPALTAHAGATLGPCPLKAGAEIAVVPSEFSLAQNYPNPFNPTTTIEYGIPEEGTVRLVVFDLYGREVAVLVDEVKEPGTYHAQFAATELSSGMYMYQLEWNGSIQSRTMMLLK
jgi:beta-propeller repeat-containing protein/type IX secretion system substrate protein